MTNPRKLYTSFPNFLKTLLFTHIMQVATTLEDIQQIRTRETCKFICLFSTSAGVPTAVTKHISLTETRIAFVALMTFPSSIEKPTVIANLSKKAFLSNCTTMT